MNLLEYENPIQRILIIYIIHANTHKTAALIPKLYTILNWVEQKLCVTATIYKILNITSGSPNNIKIR